MPVSRVGRPLKRLEDPKLVTGRDPCVAPKIWDAMQAAQRAKQTG